MLQIELFRGFIWYIKPFYCYIKVLQFPSNRNCVRKRLMPKKRLRGNKEKELPICISRIVVAMVVGASIHQRFATFPNLLGCDKEKKKNFFLSRVFLRNRLLLKNCRNFCQKIGTENNFACKLIASLLRLWADLSNLMLLVRF